MSNFDDDQREVWLRPQVMEYGRTDGMTTPDLLWMFDCIGDLRRKLQYLDDELIGKVTVFVTRDELDDRSSDANDLLEDLIARGANIKIIGKS